MSNGICNVQQFHKEISTSEVTAAADATSVAVAGTAVAEYVTHVPADHVRCPLLHGQILVDVVDHVLNGFLSHLGVGRAIALDRRVNHGAQIQARPSAQEVPQDAETELFFDITMTSSKDVQKEKHENNVLMLHVKDNQVGSSGVMPIKLAENEIEALN